MYYFEEEVLRANASSAEASASESTSSPSTGSTGVGFLNVNYINYVRMNLKLKLGGNNENVEIYFFFLLKFVNWLYKLYSVFSGMYDVAVRVVDSINRHCSGYDVYHWLDNSLLTAPTGASYRTDPSKPSGGWSRPLCTQSS